MRWMANLIDEIAAKRGYEHAAAAQRYRERLGFPKRSQA